MIDHAGIEVADWARATAFCDAAIHANYYGAFVFDPDGNNIEAVCHDPA